jgi:hypothetical protein
MITAWHSRTTGLPHSVTDTGGPTLSAADKLPGEHTHRVSAVAGRPGRRWRLSPDPSDRSGSRGTVAFSVASALSAGGTDASGDEYSVADQAFGDPSMAKVLR